MISDHNINGKQVNCRDKDGWTPLHLAALFDKTRCAAELLKDASVDKDVVNTNGWTPLHVAAWRGNKATVELLVGTVITKLFFYPLLISYLEKGADMRLKNNDQVSPSQLALRCKEYEIADMLKVLAAMTRELTFSRRKWKHKAIHPTL